MWCHHHPERRLWAGDAAPVARCHAAQAEVRSPPPKRGVCKDEVLAERHEAELHMIWQRPVHEDHQRPNRSQPRLPDRCQSTSLPDPRAQRLPALSEQLGDGCHVAALDNALCLTQSSAQHLPGHGHFWAPTSFTPQLPSHSLSPRAADRASSVSLSRTGILSLPGESSLSLGSLRALRHLHSNPETCTSLLVICFLQADSLEVAGRGTRRTNGDIPILQLFD